MKQTMKIFSCVNEKRENRCPLYYCKAQEAAQIKADDYFLRGGEKYRVLALGWQETLSDGTTGVLTVTARKEAGSSAKEI